MSINKIYIYIFSLFLFTSCIDDEVINKNADPKENFQLLWKTVDENYCFFDLKEIDWKEIKIKYEKKVTDDMDEKALFAICSDMLNELKDGHVNLSSDFNTSRYWDWFTDYPQNFNWGIVERNYLGKDYIIAGKIKARNINSIGYLRYESFENLITSKNTKEIIKQLGPIKGLIIDIRDNGGGYETMVDTLASSFFDKKTIVGYIRYKEGPSHSDFSKYFPRYIKRTSDDIYKGEIVVLTNRLVYSSANYFVSVMSTLPNVTIIGDKTGGGGGAPFSSELYNGWKFRISRDPLFNSNKEYIENGIEPDIYVNINPIDESNNTDTIIEYAINYLLNK